MAFGKPKAPKEPKPPKAPKEKKPKKEKPPKPKKEKKPLKPKKGKKGQPVAEEVEGADGRAVVPLDDQAELARLVDVEALLLDEACERMARERRRGAAHVPHLGIVLPGVHPFGVLRFEGPQAAERTFDVHRRQSPMMRLRISIATPQALAFSLIFESRNLVSLYTRLSEYLLVADLRGSMM